jgi:copper homeostasis protein
LRYIFHERQPIQLLLSGHSNTAVNSLGVLPSIFRHAEELAIRDKRQRPITLLVGSGINPVTVDVVLECLAEFGLQEIHLTGGRWVEGEMWHRPERMNMGVPGNEWSVWRTSQEAIREVRVQADAFL